MNIEGNIGPPAGAYCPCCTRLSDCCICGSGNATYYGEECQKCKPLSQPKNKERRELSDSEIDRIAERIVQRMESPTVNAEHWVRRWTCRSCGALEGAYHADNCQVPKIAFQKAAETIRKDTETICTDHGCFKIGDLVETDFGCSRGHIHSFDIPNAAVKIDVGGGKWHMVGMSFIRKVDDANLRPIIAERKDA